jgi:hypothetical protein
LRKIGRGGSKREGERLRVRKMHTGIDRDKKSGREAERDTGRKMRKRETNRNKRDEQD